MSRQTQLIIVCIIGAVIMPFFLVQRVSQGLNSSEWPMVKGQFKKGCQVYRGYLFRWERYVEYTYHVQGRPYSEKFRSTSFPEDILERFSNMNEGQQLDVYYNPVEPSQSTLVPGYFDTYHAKYEGLLSLIFFGILGIIFLRTRNDKQSKPQDTRMKWSA